MVLAAIRMVALFVGLLWSTYSYGWDGYQIFMWCNFMATCAFNWVRSASGYLGDDVAVILSSAGGLLALAAATWLVWPIVGDHLPGTWLSYILMGSGGLLGILYGIVLLYLSPFLLQWLVCKLAPDSWWARYIDRKNEKYVDASMKFADKLERKYR